MATGGILNPAGMFRAIPLQILEKIFPVAKNILSELFVKFVEQVENLLILLSMNQTIFLPSKHQDTSLGHSSA